MTLKVNGELPRMDRSQLEEWFNDIKKNTHYMDIVILRDMMTEEIDKTRAQISGVPYEPRNK